MNLCKSRPKGRRKRYSSGPSGASLIGFPCLLDLGYINTRAHVSNLTIVTK